MKIALCFAGQLRSAEKAVEYYKRNLLNHYDVDIFFHTWSYDIPRFFNVFSKNYRCDMPYIKEYQDKINIKYTNTPNPTKWPPAFTVQSFDSINRVNQLLIQEEILNDKPYDWVIKTRFDYALNKKIDFEFLDNSKLYVPNCRMTPQHNFCNDQFAFGNSLTMRKYMSTFQYMDLFYRAGVTMIGEDMLAANLAYHKLTGPENLVYVDMNNPFPPGPHNGSWHSLIRDDYEQWSKL